MRESWLVQEWLEEGRQEGRQTGRQEEAQRFLRCLLVDKFGALPDWAEEKLQDAEIAQIEIWGQRTLRATILGEVFTD